MRHTVLTLMTSALLSALLGGCATRSTDTHAPPADLSPAPSAAAVLSKPAGECPVWVYRTQSMFMMLSPSLPYIFVNGVEIGTIAIGRSFCLNLPAGKYQVASREPLLYMPGSTSGSVIVEVKEGVPPQYIRYSKEMGAVIPMGAGVSVQGNSQLRSATKAEWEARR